MPVKVDLYGTHRLMAGEKTIELHSSPGFSLLDAINVLVVQYPQLRADLLDASGNLFAFIPIFINGRNPRLFADGLNTVIKDGDVISIFSPVASGHINVEDANRSLTKLDT